MWKKNRKRDAKLVEMYSKGYSYVECAKAHGLTAPSVRRIIETRRPGIMRRIDSPEKNKIERIKSLPKWEYEYGETEDRMGPSSEVFNKMGRQGWEFVTMIDYVDYCGKKRPIPLFKRLLERDS